MGYTSAPSQGGGGGTAAAPRTVFLAFGAASFNSSSAVHANVRGDEAANEFPGPFTNPDIPRAVSVSFGETWDGGDVTVTGTNQYGGAISEVFPTPVPVGYLQTIDGEKCFATVTSITKGAVGADADVNNYVSVGVCGKLGIVDDDVSSETDLVAHAYAFRDAGGSPTAAEVDNTNKTVDFGFDPNGINLCYAIIGLAP